MAEPTVSGLHDLKRVLRLSLHFEIAPFLCIAKADLNPDVAEEICHMAERFAAPVLTSIDYDPSANRAQIEARPLVKLRQPGRPTDRAALGRSCRALPDRPAPPDGLPIVWDKPEPSPRPSIIGNFIHSTLSRRNPPCVSPFPVQMENYARTSATVTNSP